MKIAKTYKTLADTSQGIYKEKGSKFIAYAVPCDNTESVKMFLEQWRKEHHQARHVCYAYRLGYDKSEVRANDDGEPNNSAGMPILGQIVSFDLTNVLIGVVRYFGGVKLGVGGLVTAYKSAAKDAIEQGEIIEKTIKDRLELFFEYADMPMIMELVKNQFTEIKQQEFHLDCYLEIAVESHYSEQLIEQLKNFKSIKINEIEVF